MPINYRVDGKIAIFEIDNAPVNALTPTMHKEFYDHLKSFVADRKVHVGILTGKGTKAFCGGDDIKNVYKPTNLGDTLDLHFWPSDPDDPNVRPGWEREVKHIERFKPIIGAVNGPAMGMGLIYLLNHTDIRIGVPNATLGLPEVAYGMGGAGGTTQLWRHLPRAIASWILLTGEPLTAKQAHEFHLINEIVEPDRLMERALKVAAKIARHPPLAVRVEMEAFHRSMDLTKNETLTLVNHLYRLQRATYLLQPGTTPAPLAKPAKGNG